ncbi:MAG TPA: DUF4384 domain-containing protein [Azospirillum sp.]|nr:DUF4384 domain-containing protein [Azospirillum sp.]
MYVHLQSRRPIIRSALAPPGSRAVALPGTLTPANAGRFLCAAMILAVGCTQAAAARAAEAVVVASTAPGYRLGQVVPDGTAVQVPDGASTMFLFASGRTVRVKGPYDGQIDKGPDTAARPPGGGLLSSERFVQNDLGAARAIGNPLDRAVERAFAIDPAVSGTYCVKAGSPPTLRRPQEPGLNQVVLQDGRGASAKVVWADAAATAPWPRELSLKEGAEIRVASADGVPRTALRFREVDAPPGSAALAVHLASAGCTGQAAEMLASLRDATVPLDLYLSTDRGTTAAYRPGDEVRLMLQTNRDAHVYCYLRNARAQLIPIFPSGPSKSALIEGSVPVSLSGDRMPQPVRVGDDPGDMDVRCFAANRNLDRELPGRADAFYPLTQENVAKLDRTLSKLRDTELVTAQVILRVR